MEVDILYVCNRIDIITCIMGVIVWNHIGMKFIEKSVILMCVYFLTCMVVYIIWVLKIDFLTCMDVIFLKYEKIIDYL